ncbi:hypothetical protein [Rhodococcus sp. NPDC058521]|uniref:hypothetical protein n=1 Tax=Rhodococcus sp. NPDC058521 TaxID=3346536 RepID=UPI003660D2D3
MTITETSQPVARTREWVPAARILLSGGAILATVPYLTLKALWLTGNEVGVTDRDFLADPVLHALNFVTAGMDVIAIVLALAFVTRLGNRIPAALLLLPAWVASGLLGPIVVATPLTSLVSASGTSDSGLPLADWVRPIVYGGFAVQGVFLVGGFLFYAAHRWGHTVHGDLEEPAGGPGQTMRRQLVIGASAFGAATTAASLAWAWGLPWGQPADMLAARDATSAIVGTITELFAIAGILGSLALVHGIPRGRSYGIAALAAWLGSGSMFAWGMWGLMTTLTTSPLSGATTEGMSIQNVHTFFQTAVGLVLGVMALTAVVARSEDNQASSER